MEVIFDTVLFLIQINISFYLLYIQINFMLMLCVNLIIIGYAILDLQLI